MVCVGIFPRYSDSFLEICAEINIDQRHINNLNLKMVVLCVSLNQLWVFKQTSVAILSDDFHLRLRDQK